MARKDWIIDSEVLPLFPTLVWKTQLSPGVKRSINDRIGPVLKAMVPELSHSQAWQSHHGLHELEEFAELITFVIDPTCTGTFVIY